MPGRMRVIWFERSWWLVVDETTRPRYLIHHAAAVHQLTRETHVLYRVERWQLDRKDRQAVHWADTLSDATSWCRRELETPSFAAPIVDHQTYGSAVTVEEQRERWEAGLDPRTGRPREGA